MSGPGSPVAAATTTVGVGVDAVDVARLRAVLERRPGVARRVFTEAERRDAGRAVDPTEKLAARFAAKEATMKALGHGLGAFALRDVEVVRSEAAGSAAGAPSLRLGPAAAALARQRRVVRFHLSMTHTAQVAVAVVVAEGSGAASGAG